tara:strand:- start:74 stop:559 length:486 start_codon:yes stop_codon:yes gene_type:complete
MKQLIICIGILLSFTSCQKEELEPVCPVQELLSNTDISLYTKGYDQQNNHWVYRGYYNLDSNNVTAQTKWDTSFNSFVADCTPEHGDQCFSNGDDIWLQWNLYSMMSQPDIEIHSVNEYYYSGAEPDISGYNATYGTLGFYLKTWDLNININSGDTIIFYN